MSDYFFQQPDEADKKSAWEIELERIRRIEEAEAKALKMSPLIFGGQAVPIDGLSHPALGPEIMPSDPYMSDRPSDMPDPVSQSGPFDMLFDTALGQYINGQYK